jgi:geranylgeranyl diphosphate synthase type I
VGADTLATVPTDSPLDVADVRSRVSKAVETFLADQETALLAIGDELIPVLAGLTDLLTGGKRLRPTFAYWGWRAAGQPDDDAMIVAAASLELLQACALIHDDVMDDSDTRRGHPAAHRRFTTMHEDAGWRGSPDRFGIGSAILIGDLCLSWADEMLFDSGLPDRSLLRAKPILDDMRRELMAGQYLDLVEQARGGSTVDGALRVARFKSAKYTVERPLHLGAALGGGDETLLSTLSDYGLPLGEAFQLRDDVLGVFGDPEQTGKPAGDDLREGKRTALVAAAIERADARQRRVIDQRLGAADLDAAGVAALREVIVSTDALVEVERLIAELTEQSLAALSGLPHDVRDVLAELALAATSRHT